MRNSLMYYLNICVKILNSTLTYQDEGCEHTGTTPVASDGSTAWRQSVQLGGVQQAVTPHHPPDCPFSHVKQLLDIIPVCSHFERCFAHSSSDLTFLSLVKSSIKLYE